MFRIAILGDINVDLLLPVDRLPPRGGEAVGAGMETSLGGSAARTACWLGACGAEVRLAACLGDDPWGKWSLGELRRRGLPTDWVQWTQAATTGIFLLLVEPDGERTMLGARGANAQLRWEGIGTGWLEEAHWLHLSGYAFIEGPQAEAARRALVVARERGIPVSLDPGLCAAELAKDALLSACAEVDLFLPNLEEARRLVGDGPPEVLLERLTQLVPRGEVYLKLGKEGCLCYEDGKLAKVAAPQVAAANTTGAGDAFAAGAIIGALSGWGTRPRALLAVLLGTLATLRPPPPLEEAVELVEGLTANGGERELLRRFLERHRHR